MQLTKFIHEVAESPYYRTRPISILQFAYAKWLFSRSRLTDPLAFLESLGVSKDTALAGFHQWRPLLEGVIEAVQQREGQQGGVSMEDGLMLWGLTRALRPQYVIETGVAAGVSTSFIGAALIENSAGKLYSIELPPQDSRARQDDGTTFDWPDAGVGWAIPDSIKSKLGSRHTLILRDVRSALPELLGQLPHVDIFFHDDLHTPDHMLWEFETVWPHIFPGGFLISDDANFGWVEFCRKHRLSENGLPNIQRLTALRKPGISAR
jgi:hypothetical protein